MDEGKMHFKKTRIAPTPSGFLHLGNAYSFALTAALAGKYGARILLRIDDLDRERVQKQYVQDIFDTLNFLEIPWHEGPRNMDEYEKQYSQIHRLDLYRQTLDMLQQQSLSQETPRGNSVVFACTCSRPQTGNIYPGTCTDKGIPMDAEEVNWRLSTNPAKKLKVNTLREGVIEAALPPEMTDFVVRKKDGFPAYQLASVIDDVHFGVDLIVRGQDLWDSTLAQLYLADVLGTKAFQNSTFHHHPLLTSAAGGKLSKSAGDTSIRYLRQHGHTCADIYSQITAMLGLSERIVNFKQFAELLV